MGIKYFFAWMKKTFVNHIKTLNARDNLKDTVNVDTFLIDMNGIFHYCCQKVYRYGSFKHLSNDLNKNKKTNSRHLQTQLFHMVGNYVDKLVAFVQPRQRLVMAIDGSAPLSKQYQQRSRRYKSSLENSDGVFDSNSITPGTLFLDHMSKYLDWHIRTRITNGTWGDIDVIFSSERCAGEGEHKLVKYIRDHCNHDDTSHNYMMHGMDADLVMLSLATQKPNFYILRDNPYRYEYEYFYIDLKAIRENLVSALLCEQSLEDDRIYINDFIAMIFFTGNDFLPHIPTINILDNGIEHLFDTYRKVVKYYGTLTSHSNVLNIESLQHFIGTLSHHEQSFLCEKRMKPSPYPDYLLEKYTSLLPTVYTHEDDSKEESIYTIDFDGYRRSYYSEKLGCNNEKEIEKACHLYIDGLQWVLTYYTKGVSDWQWNYPYRYAPFLSDLSKYLTTYKHSIPLKRDPYPPFLQLLCVLPPKSNHLIPHPISELMSSPSLKECYPDEFKIDMDGKLNEWEGIVLLPDLNIPLIQKEYYKQSKLLDQRDKARNIPGKTFSYRVNMGNPYFYKSYYGDIEKCIASQSILQI